ANRVYTFPVVCLGPREEGSMTPRIMWRSVASAVLLGACVSAVWAQGQAPQGQAPQGQAPVDRVAAIVNGEKIMESEVRAILGTRPPTVVLTAAQKKEMQESAVNMLVDDALMRQFLKKYVAAATPQEVQKDLTDLADDLKKKN